MAGQAEQNPPAQCCSEQGSTQDEYCEQAETPAERLGNTTQDTHCADLARDAQDFTSDQDSIDKPGPTEWQPHPVGVGPWEKTYPDQPRPEGEHWDTELLEAGDTRNVVDAYRYWSREAIVADIDTRRHELHIAIENFEHDSNIGTVVRTANAFAVDTVHIVGRKRWNRRGAMVTDRYQHVQHHATVAEVLDYAEQHDLVVVAVDNTPGCVPLETSALPRRCLLLFGQEGPGVTAEAQAGARMTVSIAQFGSTRSINAGVAAGIAMHAWVRQHADLSRAW